MRALSIVYPNGSKIADGLKTLEIRSWRPDLIFGEDLLIIENRHFLDKEGDTDPNGYAVAIVKIHHVREFLESDIIAACASRYAPGYFAWELTDIRKLDGKIQIIAARGLYEVDWPKQATGA